MADPLYPKSGSREEELAADLAREREARERAERELSTAAADYEMYGDPERLLERAEKAEQAGVQIAESYNRLCERLGQTLAPDDEGEDLCFAAAAVVVERDAALARAEQAEADSAMYEDRWQTVKRDLADAVEALRKLLEAHPTWAKSSAKVWVDARALLDRLEGL